MTTSTNRFRIYIRDRPTVDAGNMPLIGEIDKYLTFESTLRHNAIGAWQLTISPNQPDHYPSDPSLIQPGRGVVVYAEDEPNWPVFSGPITQIETEWSVDAGVVTTVSGKCDNALLKERVARVSPDREIKFEGEGSDDDALLYWPPEIVNYVSPTDITARPPTSTGEWIWSLITFNFTNYWFSGDSDDSRVVRHLKIAREIPPEIFLLPDDTAWQGFPINMADLSTTLFQAAEAAGLVLRLMWQPRTRSEETTNTGVDGIFLSISQVNDRSEDIVFGPEQGNISSYKLTSVAPDATRMWIEAETTQNDRRWLGLRKNTLFNPAGWKSWDSRNSLGEHYLASDWSDPNSGRQAIEVDWNTTAEGYQDARDIPWPFQPDPQGNSWAEQPHAGSDAAAQVDQAALSYLVENGPKGLLTMEALNAPGCQYGTDYEVSDVVRILVDTSTLPASMIDEDGVLREMVREVKISSSKDAIWKIEPAVGSADSSPTPYIYRELKRLRSKVEDTASRTEGDQTKDIRPYQPHLGIVSVDWFTPPDHAPWSKTERPQVDQFYQIYVNVNGGDGDPRYPVVGTAELQLELRQGEDGDWTPSPQSQIYTNVATQGNVWFHNSSIDTLNAVKYWRARFVVNGVYSAWSNLLKVTASSGALNTGGAVVLNALSPTTRHQFANITLTGTDTTRGSLQLQSFHSGSWVPEETIPTYTGGTYSFPYYVSDQPGTVQLRVQSFDTEGKVVGVVKTSNTISFTVVAP